MPKGLKPVRRKLADGTLRLYWYHRATGKALKHDPETAEGLLEVKALDDRAKVGTALSEAATGSYAALWAAYRDSPEWRRLRPRTRSDYQAVRDWLGKAADKPATSLTSTDVLQLRDKAAKAKGRRFANYLVAVLRLTFEWGRPRKLCKENPAKGIKPIRKPTADREVNRAWTWDEVNAFVQDAPTQLKLPLALGLFAGMRQGDALRVTWAAYDGVCLRWIASKNGATCIAPVTTPLKELIEDAKAKRGDALQIAVTSAGTPWTASGFRASFFKRVRKLVSAGAMAPGCTFHGLRHTLGTNAREAGESEFRVAAAIGDRSTAMAALYGRNADRENAQWEILEASQKRYANIDWKTKADRLENASSDDPAK